MKSQKTNSMTFDKTTAMKSERKSDRLTINLSYPCFTTYWEMKNLLLCLGLLMKHYNYEFNILKGIHHLSEVSSVDSTSGRLEFFLPLFLLEVSFTLPLPNFI